MNREQFYGRLAALDEQRLHKALWTLYWRGSAAMRQRIEEELDAVEHGTRPQPAAKEPVDSDWVRDEVRDFVTLARSGAYLGGDRGVSPRERTRWRFTFGRLAADARRGLRGPDPDIAAAALEQLIDLACELRDYDYFRSEDPVEAARFVVSDAVALLWASLLDRSGFAPFAERAAAQLIRWESRYGWTRTGFGRLTEKETTLATALGRMLRVPDMWVAFADAYLDALDDSAGGAAANPTRGYHPRRTTNLEERTAALADWHRLLLDKLAGGEAEDRLDRLAQHPALRGPELKFVQAQLARRRGDLDAARHGVSRCLDALPGHPGFLQFATEIEAPLPSRARQILKERRAVTGQIP
jgi:hypothetical protein